MTNKWYQNNRTLYIIFIVCWLVLNLVQAFVSQLHYDESYYWVYSQNLNWGYFDHPPMVALLVKMGYSIFHNELGVRLVFVLLGTGTLALLLYLINETEKLSLLLIFILSITLIHLHVSGFIAIPDTPLVFFATLFFVLYREFLKKESYWLAIALGFVASAMLYSKYHGVLILFFTVVSNYKILANKKIGLAILIIVILMMPHLWWQIQHQFPTLNFQLMGRIGGIRFKEPLNYILGQLVLPGILTGVILIFFAIIYKPVDIFEKTLKWNVLGFYLFFLVFSFRTRIEPHWTAAIIPPLAYISFKAIRDKEKLLKWFKPLAIVGIFLLFFVRIVIANDAVANVFKVDSKFNNWKSFVERTKNIAKGREVIFVSNYKRASEYSFYTGKMTQSVARVGYRYSHFDFFHFDDSVINKNAVIIRRMEKTDSFYLAENGEKLYYFNVPSYKTYHYLNLSYNTEKIFAQPKEHRFFNIILTNNSKEIVFLNKVQQLEPFICCEVMGAAHYDWSIGLNEFTTKDLLQPGDTINVAFNIKFPDKAGEYACRFHVTYGKRLRASSGKAVKVEIK